MTTIHHELDTDALLSMIDAALSLQDNAEVFAGLVKVIAAKKELEDLLEKVERIEREAKGAIHAKATTLYGHDWQTLVGPGYKITRYYSGSIYSRIDGEKVAKKFLKIVESLDTKAIDAHLDEAEALPQGLELNNNRTEVIKVTIKD
jgi:hypothetical protein